ncbi:MAG: Maf family protein [Pseudomonadota bacterium]
MPRLVLASGSAVRADLMRAAGLRFEVSPATLDERAVERSWIMAGGAASVIPLTLARAKAKEVSLRRPGAVVVGADQGLFLDGSEPLSKAETLDEARARLRAMRGATHRLSTGCAVVADQEVLAETAIDVHVTLRDLSDAEIDRYLLAAGDGVIRSVACYEIESLGLALISRLDGDYFTALGLPMLWLLNALREHGVGPFSEPTKDGAA